MECSWVVSWGLFLRLCLFSFGNDQFYSQARVLRQAGRKTKYGWSPENFVRPFGSALPTPQPGNRMDKMLIITNSAWAATNYAQVRRGY